MQEKDIIDHSNAKCHLYIINMQEENNIEHVDGQCHVFAF